MARLKAITSKAVTLNTLQTSAPWAAQHLNLIAQGKIEHPNPVRVDVCKYIINQIEGAPTQKHDHQGRVILDVRFDRNELDQAGRETT